MRPETAKQTTYTTLEPIKITAPTVRVTKNAVKWLTAMADIHSHEVGVFGFVDELPDNVYVVRDIFYPKHSEANGATCEISPEGETLMAEWLMSHNREADLSKVKFWGHSHVDMGVGPSTQDEDQSIKRMNMNESYLIRGIFNKAGLLSISFYDYVNKRRFDNIKWESDEDEDDKAIRAKIIELKAINMPEVKTYGTGYGTGYNNEYANGKFGDDEFTADTFNSRRSFGDTPGTGNKNAIIVRGGGNDRFFTQFSRKDRKKNKKKHSYSYEFAK
jgi:hypothetical protein